jgi:hypothetical protein
MAMSFWQAYRRAALYALEALWWIARIAAVVWAIMWFWWKGWYIALAIAVILALAGALALQAREIQRWHQPRQK